MRLAKMVFVVVALFWPAAAQAVEVNLGIGSEAVYDSNVFRSSGNDKGDFSFRFSPTISSATCARNESFPPNDSRPTRSTASWHASGRET